VTAPVRVVVRGRGAGRPIESIAIRVVEPSLDDDVFDFEPFDFEEPLAEDGYPGLQSLEPIAEQEPAVPRWRRLAAKARHALAGRTRRAIGRLADVFRSKPKAVTVEAQILELEEIFGKLPAQIVEAVRSRAAFADLERLATERAGGTLPAADRAHLLLELALRVRPELDREAILEVAAAATPEALGDWVETELGWSDLDAWTDHARELRADLPEGGHE
jgi:hypothetical protein